MPAATASAPTAAPTPSTSPSATSSRAIAFYGISLDVPPATMSWRATTWASTRPAWRRWATAGSASPSQGGDRQPHRHERRRRGRRPRAQRHLGQCGNSGVLLGFDGTEGNIGRGQRDRHRRDGTGALGNGEHGILHPGRGPQHDRRLGGASGNWIAGNAIDGVRIEGVGATRQRRAGQPHRDWIRRDRRAGATGATASRVSNARRNLIGGPATGEGNVIGGNAGDGVKIVGPAELYGPGLAIDFTDRRQPWTPRARLGVERRRPELPRSSSPIRSTNAATWPCAVRRRVHRRPAGRRGVAIPQRQHLSSTSTATGAAGDKPYFAAGNREGCPAHRRHAGQQVQRTPTDFTNARLDGRDQHLPGGLRHRVRHPAEPDRHPGRPGSDSRAGPASNIRFNLAVTDNDRLIRDAGHLWHPLAPGEHVPVAGTVRTCWVVDLVLDDGEPV